MSDTENNEPQGGNDDDAPLVAIIADDGSNPLFKAQQQAKAKEPTPAERVSSALADFLSVVAPVAVATAKHDAASEQHQDKPQGEGFKWEPMEDLGYKPDGWDAMRAEAKKANQEQLEAIAAERQKEARAAKTRKEFADLAGDAQHHAEEQAALADGHRIDMAGRAQQAANEHSIG